ncbi:hypothetical protein HEP73_00368 [Xanthomonas sp. GW]|uniref:hypothetical protein n=1 Tax=Xanthomonas sp. GW TaxID=2724121 RepID=UPI00185FD114|nr:hypothetical protein [Xanthomonas sp. GW]QNH19478.1 hypothetical protein HEP73_00368 [Xanthomonas sp. GW]
MKRWIWILVAFFGLQGVANAVPVYEDLSCRKNDPFVFCTQGCKGKDKNWIPVTPSAGLWVAAPTYCPWPTTTGPCCVGNVCFRTWTQTAVDAVGEYMRICPDGGGKASDWKGRQRPEKVPEDH